MKLRNDGDSTVSVTDKNGQQISIGPGNTSDEVDVDQAEIEKLKQQGQKVSVVRE